MPKSRHPARHYPKPWRRDSVFTQPTIRRLSAPALRAWCGFIHAARRQQLISSGRLLVAKQLLQLAGWRGRGQIALSELAIGAEVSTDTTGRALNDLEALKLVRRHHMIRRDRDGRVVQDATFFELLPPPESDPQGADALVPYGLKISFLARKLRPRLWIKPAPERGGKAPPSSGDDEWGFWNGARQIELVASWTRAARGMA